MSPGRSRVLRAACATIASHEWCIVAAVRRASAPRRSRARPSPALGAVELVGRDERPGRGSSRSPSPSPGRARSSSRRRCRSRADQSFMTVKPPISPSAPIIAADLELVVELLAAFGVRDLVLGPVDRGRVGEVEGRDLVPLGHHLEARAGRARSSRAARRRRSRGPTGGCSTGGRSSTSASGYSACSRAVAAAGEERLQRLRRELDHAVALDAARPAALAVLRPSG